MANMYVCRVFKVKSLFKSAILLVLLTLSFGGFAQVTLTNSPGNTAFIDFSATMPAGVGNGAYTGAGFQPTPSSGRLDSDAWAADRWSDGTLSFGGTFTTNDFARGSTAAAVITGGFYAYTGTPASVSNPIFYIQPSGPPDFTPGTLTLRIYNNGTSAITQLAVAYDLYVRNDQDRSNSFNFQWSTDNVNYNDVAALDYTSPAALDAAGLVLVDGPAPSRSTTITSQNILPGTYFYLRWRSEDVGGSGQRDEFGLDDINITATYGAICTPPTTQASSTGFSNVLPGQMDVNFTRGNGTGGLMVIAVENAALSTNPFNGAIYTANSNFGTGSAIGNGFVVYNSNAVPALGAGSFTVLGLNPSTTYNFYFIEYNGVGSPCYKLPPNSGTRATTAAVANPAGYFQSRITGNWNNANTWEYSATGLAPWVLSDLKPTSAAAGIFIRPTHTVTMVANESAAKLTIDAGAILENTNALNGGYRLTMVDKAGDDLTVNGTLKLYGNIPTLVTGLNAVVNTGGMVHVIDNKGDAASDDFARSPQVKFYTDAVFNWNTVLSFETSSQDYFTAGAADVPVFRISSIVSNVGSAGYTYIHGLFECNAATTWNFGGIKRFRNGIVGTANLTQAAGSGRFEISATTAQGSAKLGGAGTITLSGELQVIGGSDVLLISNKTINSGSTKIMAGGYLNTAQYIVSGTTSFEVVTTGGLGIGSAQGITTIAAGNIQTSVRTMSTTGTYRYTGISNQVTGSLLPDSVNLLFIQGPPGGGPAYTVTLSKPLKVLSTTTILGGWVFDIGATTLTCNGTISYGGGAVFRGTPSSNLTLTGGSGQNINFEAGSSLALFTMKKSGGTASWQSGVTIYEGIFFDPSNVSASVNFGQHPFTLKSTATHTAYFSRLYGNITSNSTSRFTVERYIPTGTDHGRSWQLLAVPIDSAKSAQTINQAWQDTATSANDNRYPGYGTMITGATNDPTFTLGFDAFTPLGSTMKTFVPGPTGSWANITGTKNNRIGNRKGYMVLVRGDRGVTAVTGPGSTAVPTVLRATGQLYYGATTNAAPGTTIPPNSFESVGNPYASAIDFTLVFKSASVDKTFYAWDPLLPGSSGLGGYQTISESALWMPMPGGTTNYPTGVPVTTIQSGQAVLMHATGGPGNVLIQDEDKVISSENVFRQPLRANMLQARLYTPSGALADGNAVVFGNEFSNDYDGRDAVKVANNGENFGIAAHSKVISILTRKAATARDTIHYQMWNLTRGNHKFIFTPVNFAGSERVILVDRFMGAETEVSRSEPTEYSFEISNTAGSYQPNRFYIVFRNATTNLRVEEMEPTITIVPNPVAGKRLGLVLSAVPIGQYQVTVLQADGTRIFRTYVLSTGGRDVMTFNLPPATVPGVYKVLLESRGWRGDARAVVE